jgi:hypothetical protein
MCLAVPGKILDIEHVNIGLRRAKVDLHQRPGTGNASADHLRHLLRG